MDAEDNQPGEPIGNLTSILPWDWSGPKYPSFVGNAIFLAHADTTETLLELSHSGWKFILAFLDFVVFAGIIALMFLTWDNKTPGVILPLLVKCVFDFAVFLLVPNFMLFADRFSFKFILPVLVLGVVLGVLASQETNLAKEYLIEISVGIFFLVAVHFFAHNYLERLLKGDTAKIGLNLIKILFFWLGILSIAVVAVSSDQSFLKEYLMEVGFGLTIGFAIPPFSAVLKGNKVFIWIIIILAVIIAVIGYFQTGLLQAFLYEFVLSLFLLVGLDYTFRRLKRKSKRKVWSAAKDKVIFDDARDEAEKEEEERKLGTPLYVERPPDDYEEGKPYY